MQDLQKILQKRFSLKSFRTGQKEIIESVTKKNDTLVFMPTGGGKSLTYQLPGIILDGLVLVISPLISLMKDQVDKLNELGLKAELLNSTTDFYDKKVILNNISRDDESINFLYIAPERLNNEEFLRVISQVKIALVAIDEAHCISQWGHDFRPSYMKIRGFLEELKKRQIFPIIALTATATQKVRKDIIERLGIENPNIFTTGFDRKNITIVVREISKKEEKLEKLKEILEKTPGVGIIYCASRKSVKEVYDYLVSKNIKTGIYTGEMIAEKRENEQNNFMNDKYKVVVATNAFGMGIDKKDISFVVHFNLPGSIENYYQEIGRAGRDGEKSFGVVLASFGDTKIQEFFIENSNPSREDILKFYKYLFSGFKIGEGKGEKILKTYKIMASESEIKNDLLVGAILRILEKYGIVKRGVESEGFRGRGIEIIQEKRKEEHILIDWKHQELLRDEAYFKLEQIKKLLFFPSCRKKFILKYFGDEEDLEKLGENCGTCDFCIEKKKSGTIEDLVKISVFTLVLETVKKYDEKFGVGTFVKILYGSKDKKILDWNLDKSDFFGALNDFTSDIIQAVIESLISLEFLYKTDGQYPLLGLSETGRVSIFRNYLLTNENEALQHFIRMKVGNRAIFRKTSAKASSKKGGEKKETILETLEMLKNIKTSHSSSPLKVEKIIKKISQKRELKDRTIEEHLLKLYEIGKLNLAEILEFSSFAKLKKVKDIINCEFKSGIEKLRPVKEKLEEIGEKDISYFDIKLGILMIKKRDL